MKLLVVKSAFGGHDRGTTITDPQEIEAILGSENAQHVSLTEHEDETAPAEKPKKSRN